MDTVYTLGVWRVKPGQNDAFVNAWKDLGRLFAALPLPPANKGVLIQSLTDSSLYYSFGPWRSADDIAAMRRDQNAQEGIRRLASLCTEATPGSFKLVGESE